MLSSRERLQARQGQHAPPRHEYLQQLVDEYQRSSHMLRKQEIVANLANFAYDPINYASFAQLQVMDLFLDILDADLNDAQQQLEATGNSEQDSANHKQQHTTVQEKSELRKYQLPEFAIGGICNCIADPVLQHAFLEGDGFSQIEPYILSIPDFHEPLTTTRVNTILSALAIAFFLLDSSAFAIVTMQPIVAQMQRVTDAHPNVQVANTAAAFLTRYEELLNMPPLPPPTPQEPGINLI
uniref:Armadillo repeat-containing domain-containing protein n=1 Tax=Globisporangium ultimum (strain ATCC 200006 / CBS 805.95 / DAOM BR144) TaxID=431595 RepID=K3XAK3_GLOUD